MPIPAPPAGPPGASSLDYAPTPPAPGPLDDVARLINDSRPQPILRQMGRGILAVWAAALIGPFLGLNAVALQVAALVATLGGSVVLAARGAALRRENDALDTLEGLLALRRTDEAVPGLQGVMGRPMNGPDNRLRAMLLLGGTLVRLGRQDDALTVYNELIDTEGLAGPGGAMVKLARATVMLRADHLYDADRAINDLRRLLDRGGVAAEMKQFNAAGPDEGVRDTDAAVEAANMADADRPPVSLRAATPGSAETSAIAGLRLLELFRDVKTGHLAEAVENFDKQLPQLRSGLGHRVADAHALVALALHRLNRPTEAAARFADATALAPLNELVRRYPEVWPLVAIYPATPVPR